MDRRLFRRSAGLGFVVTPDDQGASEDVLFQGSKSLGSKQCAFDAEVAAIEEAVKLFLGNSNLPSLTIHSDTTNAIARAGHTGAGPGQCHAIEIHRMVSTLKRHGRRVAIAWVKGHADIAGNERADKLAGSAAEKAGPSSGAPIAFLAYLKPRISDRFREAKESWRANPTNHGTEEIPPPPPKKSCLDHMRNSLACAAAQIRTGHWRSAVYLKRIRKMTNDECWFCRRPVKMTRSHVLLHCPAPKLVSARTEA